MTDLSIEELRSAYDKQWDAKDTLEDKAKNIISTSATITSLVFGFVTFSISVFKFSFPPALGLAIVGSIIASILAILISMWILKLQNYHTTINLTDLQSNLTAFKQIQDKELRGTAIDSYVICITHNHNENAKKSKNITYANIALFISIILIGVATVTTLFLFHSRPIGPMLIIPERASMKGDSYYEPDPVIVRNGDTIQVENKDSSIHTVTSGNGPLDKNAGKLFDTHIINPGESAGVIVANLLPGEYPFFCTVHPNMTGTLKVIEIGTLNSSQMPNENK